MCCSSWPWTCSWFKQFSHCPKWFIQSIVLLHWKSWLYTKVVQLQQAERASLQGVRYKKGKCFQSQGKLDPSTNEEVRGAVLLEEGVEVIPQLGHPVQHPKQLFLVSIDVTVWLYQLPPQVTDQKAIGWLHVVRESQHPVTGDRKNRVRVSVGTLPGFIPCQSGPLPACLPLMPADFFSNDRRWRWQ